MLRPLNAQALRLGRTALATVAGLALAVGAVACDGEPASSGIPAKGSELVEAPPTIVDFPTVTPDPNDLDPTDPADPSGDPADPHVVPPAQPPAAAGGTAVGSASHRGVVSMGTQPATGSAASASYRLKLGATGAVTVSPASTTPSP